MQFYAGIPFSAPDQELYVGLKHIRPIRSQPADELLPRDERIPGIVIELVGTDMASTWMSYTCHRLEAAALGQRGATAIPSPFPGRLLPRTNADLAPLDRGCTQIGWARHALEMEQPMEGIELLTKRHERSGLSVITFSDVNRSGTWEERLLRAEARELLHARDLTRAMAWVDRLWSPGQTLPTLRRSLVDLARELMELTRKNLKSIKPPQEPDSLALLIEVHDAVRRLEAHAALGIDRLGIGAFNGVWCEVGLMELAAIKATELVQTERAIQELAAIYTRGFAPVVINEWGCNTDGSHRQVATWIWNVLCVAKRKHHVDVAEAVCDFVNRHSMDMGELLVHEVERVFREAWDTPALRQIVEAAHGEARPGRCVEYLPVVLVPEWSAATVIKSLYDDEGRSVRVCPSVYAALARDHRLTLPARGPYHRTDAFLLPWFQVVPD